MIYGDVGSNDHPIHALNDFSFDSKVPKARLVFSTETLTPRYFSCRSQEIRISMSYLQT